MLGSIFIGLSGMNAFSSGLRQISSNVTNINSTGYKSADVAFSGVFAQRADLGLGVTLDTPRLNFAQGELRQSDRDLDLAVEGEGFLVLLRDGEAFFARTGSYEVDTDGYIVLAGTDYRLAVLDETGNPTAISIDAYRTNPPARTTTVRFSENLSSTATNYALQDIRVFDALGEAETWRVRFERADGAAPGEWSVIVQDAQGGEIGRQTLRFINGVVDPATAHLTFADAQGERSVDFDFSEGVTSFSSGQVSTLRLASSDGYGAGEIVAVRVNEEGELELAYSNEQKKSLGAIALARFTDTRGLKQRDRGLFERESGPQPSLLTSAHGGVGRVLSRRLEASNVNLSKEFGDLILVQRGFQASSQVVSVSNDMIQQLFGIRGQG